VDVAAGGGIADAEHVEAGIEVFCGVVFSPRSSAL